MTAISPTMIAARYPLCLNDDTLMNDDQLIRYIRHRCGDDVADAITELIYSNSIRARIQETLSSLRSDLRAVENDIDDVLADAAEIERLVTDP